MCICLYTHPQAVGISYPRHHEHGGHWNGGGFSWKELGCNWNGLGSYVYICGCLFV
jgi:hypothetical protein